jgi:hypothetical protein
MRRFCLGLIGILACGGNDGTGPGSTTISGTWSASLANLSGSGVDCSSTSPTQLTLNQTGATFSGSYSGGELFCTAPGSTGPVSVGTGSIVNGTVSGTSLSFDLGTPDFHHEGVVSGTSMSGTAQWTLDFGIPAGEVTLDGTWQAAKQ